MQILMLLAQDELIQQGARQINRQAIEVELAAMLEQYSSVKAPDGGDRLIGDVDELG